LWELGLENFETRVNNLLSDADVNIGGDRTWDIQVYDDRFFQRILTQGSLGLGESYMEGWWDVATLDQFFNKLLSTDIERRFKNRTYIWAVLQAKFFNLQSIRRAFHVGEQHYDMGNDLFECMLDKRLTYTCGYWKDAANLDQAQENKLDLVCRKIGLQENQRVLDIGCGWGSFIKFAAERYGAQAVGVTVSKEQAEYAKSDCAGLPVEVRVQDYRELNEKFDHVVSLGMFEHVGPKNHKAYMKVASRCLKDDGFFLLHTIGSNFTRHSTDPWISKYIFPNGVLPSMKDITMAFDDEFIIEDYHSFGPDYDKTLMAWFDNFENGWKHLSKKYGEQHYKMWKYYLLCCAGAFRARNLQLWQLVLSKEGVAGGYTPVR